MSCKDDWNLIHLKKWVYVTRTQSCHTSTVRVRCAGCCLLWVAAVFLGKVGPKGLSLLAAWPVGVGIVQYTAGAIKLKDYNIAGENVFTFFAAFFCFGAALSVFAQFMIAGAVSVIVGKNFIDIKDHDGVPIIRGAIDIAKSKGKGWINYKWANPATKKIERKTTYIERVDDCFISCGAYLK